MVEDAQGQPAYRRSSRRAVLLGTSGAELLGRCRRGEIGLDPQGSNARLRNGLHYLADLRVRTGYQELPIQQLFELRTFVAHGAGFADPMRKLEVSESLVRDLLYTLTSALDDFWRGIDTTAAQRHKRSLREARLHLFGTSANPCLFVASMINFNGDNELLTAYLGRRGPIGRA